MSDGAPTATDPTATAPTTAAAVVARNHEVSPAAAVIVTDLAGLLKEN